MLPKYCRSQEKKHDQRWSNNRDTFCTINSNLFYHSIKGPSFFTPPLLYLLSKVIIILQNGLVAKGYCVTMSDNGALFEVAKCILERKILKADTHLMETTLCLDLVSLSTPESPQPSSARK